MVATNLVSLKYPNVNEDGGLNTTNLTINLTAQGAANLVPFLGRLLIAAEAYCGKTMAEIETQERLKREP